MFSSIHVFNLINGLADLSREAVYYPHDPRIVSRCYEEKRHTALL